MPAADPRNLAWIDLEMTGLRPEQDRIIEIATIVTDQELNVLAEGPVLAVHQPERVLAAMDEWNQTHHGASGLTRRVRESTTTEAQAEAASIALPRTVDSPRNQPHLRQQRRPGPPLSLRHMPRLEAFFHYRNLDVSTVKILAQRWYPAVADALVKGEAHLALADIRESIAELRYYRQHIFLPQP